MTLADETTTRDLATLIADTFFPLAVDAPLPPAEQLELLDGALADALDAADEYFEVMGDELAAAVVLLFRDVRHGMIDRTGARVTAEVLVRHVAAVVGVACVEPLIRVLGAVAVLPDAPDTADLALDPTPDPDSPIEVAMAAQFDDPGARGQLRRALYDGAVIVPVLGLDVDGSELALQFLPLIIRGQPTISAFTSEARLAEHAAAVGLDVEDIPTIEVPGDELSTICPPGHGIALDPAWVLGCVLEEAEVRALPAAPSVAVVDGPDGSGDLRSAVHPSVAGVVDAVRPRLAELGANDLAVASLGEDVVIAVEVATGTSPEQALRRVGVALAERGLRGPMLVPSTSSLGRAVVAQVES